MAKSRALLVAILLFPALAAHAHVGHHHGAQTQESKTGSAEADQRRAFVDIEARYNLNVKPIFDSKCASCHSAAVQAPWYASIPGVHTLVANDMSEAKKHLEISKGFPFGGHGEPVEDLKAIQEAVTKETMPPRLFSFMHPSLKLTDDEKKTILEWARMSEENLAASAKAK